MPRILYSLRAFQFAPWLALVIAIAFYQELDTVLLAQQPAGFLGLINNRTGVHPLTPDQPSGSWVFLVDSATRIRLQVSSSIPNLITNVTAPSGATVNPETITALGGTYSSFGGLDPEPDIFLLGLNPEAFHHFYDFPSLGPGKYRVDFSSNEPLRETRAVLLDLNTDSKVRAGLLTTQDEITLGNAAVFSAAVFDGSSPVSGADVTVGILDESGQLVTMQLLDDGVDFDDLPGDGLYSGGFTPAHAGDYRAVVEIRGVDGGGNPFHRQSAARFRARETLGWITGEVSDEPFDDNGNGLHDRVVVSVETRILQPGRYGTAVRLQSAGGRFLVKSATRDFEPGRNLVEVPFPAIDLKSLEEDGPYEIAMVSLTRLDGETIRVDRRSDLAVTRPYLLSDLERPALILRGILHEEAQDRDRNGYYDRLRLTFGIEALNSGRYRFNCSLHDARGNRIAQEVGYWVNLVNGLNQLRVTFDVTRIGVLGSDGPYQIPDFVLYYSGSYNPYRGSIMTDEPMWTQPYTAGQFEPAETARILVRPEDPDAIIRTDVRTTFSAIVLTDAGFDASSVDPRSAYVGPLEAAEIHREGHWEDVDGDGDQDLILHFNAYNSEIRCGQQEVTVYGRLLDRRYWKGSAPIQTVPCNR